VPIYSTAWAALSLELGRTAAGHFQGHPSGIIAIDEFRISCENIVGGLTYSLSFESVVGRGRDMQMAVRP